jgi:hypothetical protein
MISEEWEKWAERQKERPEAWAESLEILTTMSASGKAESAPSPYFRRESQEYCRFENRRPRVARSRREPRTQNHETGGGRTTGSIKIGTKI